MGLIEIKNFYDKTFNKDTLKEIKAFMDSDAYKILKDGV
jgi:hypothetical protein